jgi:putative membrane protein
MQKTLFAVTLAALVAGCASKDEQGAPGSGSQNVIGGASGTLAAQDATFIQHASQSGMAEVRQGELTAQNGESEAVKRYGQTLVTDHTKANQELKQIATTKGASVATDLGKHQATYDRLSALKGRDFDQAFKEQAIKDHEEAIRLFEQQTQQGSDAELKAFAQKHLPHLRQHLTMAQQMKVDQPETTTEPTTQQESTAPQNTQQK